MSVGELLTGTTVVIYLEKSARFLLTMVNPVRVVIDVPFAWSLAHGMQFTKIPATSR